VYLPQLRHVKYITVVQNHNIAVPVPRPINNSLYTSDASNCMSESWTTAGTLFSPVSFSDHEASRYKSLYDVSLQTLDTNRSTMYHCQIPDTLRSPKYQSYMQLIMFRANLKAKSKGYSPRPAKFWRLNGKCSSHEHGFTLKNSSDLLVAILLPCFATVAFQPPPPPTWNLHPSKWWLGSPPIYKPFSWPFGRGTILQVP